MKRLTTIIAAVCCITFAAAGPLALTSCSTVEPYVQSAQTWLNDPKNQALISEIAQAANILIGALGSRGAASENAAVGKLAGSYPNVPAGALRSIAANPQAYLKR